MVARYYVQKWWETKSDIESAEKYSKTAVLTHDAVSQFNMACMEMEKGQYSQASYWYLLAARQGHLNAPCRLIVLYLNNLVKDHIFEGFYFLKAAAEGGHEPAKQLTINYRQEIDSLLALARNRNSFGLPASPNPKIPSLIKPASNTYFSVTAQLTVTLSVTANPVPDKPSPSLVSIKSSETSSRAMPSVFRVPAPVDMKERVRRLEENRRIKRNEASGDVTGVSNQKYPKLN